MDYRLKPTIPEQQISIDTLLLEARKQPDGAIMEAYLLTARLHMSEYLVTGFDIRGLLNIYNHFTRILSDGYRRI